MTDLTFHSGFIQASEHNAVLHVTLDRADKLNALTVAMYQDLTAAVHHLAGRDDLNALLLTAKGRSYSAGNDIQDFLKADPTSRDNGKLSPAMVLVHALMALDKPVIMAVQGNATGIGTTMLLHADLVIAADNARFHTAFINLGLVPEAGSSLILPALIGRQNAARLLMAGDTLSAEEAERCGLIAYRTEADKLGSEAMALATRLANKSPAAMAMTKQLMRHGHDAIKTQIEKESALFAERMFSEETREIFAGFLKK
ncbi:enoyl-CoA hydratase-related protein [Alcanivorax sp.]|uniref:enoyl-CoA hydratase/isomerase family protein n=1 Tax=Alcanivorax sp. TaxID=1872427 RepID=UPI0025BE44FF|nr:enoyl-CoA hydratase-related protein [Alcanivorax sp.]|tara:strand:+ start:4451 stop:5221 length:771 start_codon:yes stop_codon:yes gene_type:complete